MMVFALILPALPAHAGQRPDFSGTWAAAVDTAESVPAATAPVLGQQFAIRHEAATITVIRRVRDAQVSSTYSLDGREVRSRVPGALCIGDSESIETAAWDGNAIALTVVGSVPPGGGPVRASSIRRVLRLEAADRLVVEGSARDSATGTTRTVGTVYRRTTGQMPVPTVSPAASTTPATIAQVSWLAGVWTGPSGSDERWTPSAGGSMLGVARTLRGGVMAEFEFLCIVERGGGLVYQAMPNGRSPATDFALTAIGPDHVTFENPAHDFPKALRYTRRADGTLEAVASGDPNQRTLTFTFRKQEKP